MVAAMSDTVQAIRWENNHLVLLDQRILPRDIRYLSLDTCQETTQAIKDMVVRGAPAIGISAAYGIVLAARQRWRESPATWRQNLQQDLEELAASRPTAVNLFWAIDKMRRIIEKLPVGQNPEKALLEAAQQIHRDDIEANKTMGELGAALINQPCAVLTHCNAGALATGGYGTALGVIRSASAAGNVQHVFADETRPWLQGARLTAWEMVQENIPVTLLCEGASAWLMRQKKVAWVIVGADRIAANGDVANKIGTYNLAVNARHHGVKMMVVAPTTTIDMEIADGSAIPIEQRSQDEVLNVNGQPMAATGADAWNPAFDVTPAALIDAIVTERGVIFQPDSVKMAAVMENG